MAVLHPRSAWLLLAAVVSLILVSGSARAAPIAGASEVVTWDCTGSPCPWGSPLSGDALVWPDTEAALSDRFGYTVNRGVYLPAAKANGLTVALESGTATLYAGLPDALSHRVLATVRQGGSYRIEGLASGEVVSVQTSGAFGYVLSPPDPAQEQPLASQEVTWVCTSSPCPWGSPLSSRAVVWPQSAAPLQQRLGYTTSAAIFLPATYANGMVLQLLSGTASVYAGLPGDESHRLVANLSPGGNGFQVSGIGANEVLSVQSTEHFTFAVTRADPAAPGDPADPTGPGDPTVPVNPGEGPQTSALVVWTCVSGPCPWGSPLSGQALAWPSAPTPTNARLGYTTSAGIYLPAESAAGVSISLLSGSASAYAVVPDTTSFRVLGSISAGQTLSLTGLMAGELVSVQSSEAFTYQVAVGEALPVPPPPPPPSPDGAIQSVPAFWRCNGPECFSSDWVSAVITWPAWAAYESNARSGNNARIVHSASGELLYPYMGSWANGCEVTAVSGIVLVIEWQRGTDTWRETWLNVGQTHVINLVAPEDGAMIESIDGPTSFSVKLNNCTPQAIR